MKRERKNTLSLAVCLILSLAAGACSSTLPATPTVTLQTPAALALPTATLVSETPSAISPEERWIEVSLREQAVRLHDGERVVAEYSASTGVGTRPEYTTYPGLYDVRRQYKGPVETAPGVYVTDVLEFDIEHGNAIHSLPIDEAGTVLDNRLGQPLTAGCVRVAESATVFDFATPGMTVWVH